MDKKPELEHISRANSSDFAGLQSKDNYNYEVDYDEDGAPSHKNAELDEELFNEKPDLSWPAIRHYFATRLSTMLDLPLYHTNKKWYEVINPIPGLRLMTASDWNFYGLGFFAWALDAMDFFCVSVAAPEIALTLGISVTDVTWGVTLVLMLRSVGALIFGIASDYFGRKWTYIIICSLFCVVEIGTGFVQTYQQFLGVRAVFGILMGAMYPISMVTALEGQPVEARSVLLGLFLPGYTFGYILAMVWYRLFILTYKDGEGWRSLLWFSAGLSVILVVWRLFAPESPDFINLKKKKEKFNEQLKAADEPGKKKRFWQKFDYSIIVTLKTEWLMFSYLVLLYAGWNFTTHGSQDLYVTLLKNQYHMGIDKRTVIIVTSNIGAIVGGIIMGQMSELLGRRLTVVVSMVVAGAFLYPSFFNANQNWPAYIFLIGAVYASFSVGPAYLLELVNSTHRTLLSGVAYQLGNLVSSASATIEARIGENFPLGEPGEYDYGKVMCIFCGAVFAYMLIIIFLGPERFHKNLRIHDDEIEEVNDETGSTSTVDSVKEKV
ncbi:Carboxylic acid transporter [Candida viswanathii]|uniref:Carboxylic acid transporter n=1 Tax=Candida viswanathii TaxID=5486 RepID=A0A367YFU3_9ASCO|nr:Carboxylic acid transporter [Candida viswanathii]